MLPGAVVLLKDLLSHLARKQTRLQQPSKKRLGGSDVWRRARERQLTPKLFGVIDGFARKNKNWCKLESATLAEVKEDQVLAVSWAARRTEGRQHRCQLNGMEDETEMSRQTKPS